MAERQEITCGQEIASYIRIYTGVYASPLPQNGNIQYVQLYTCVKNGRFYVHTYISHDTGHWKDLVNYVGIAISFKIWKNSKCDHDQDHY